ncbi:MAG: DNA-processing protein DprA [Sphingomonas sp.]
MNDGREARLRLIRSANVGPVTYVQLIARFGDARAALEALPMFAARGGGRAPQIADAATVRREIAAVERLGARHLFLGDPDYPPLLAELETAPPALILRGSVALAARTCVAMVGARNASAAALPFRAPARDRAGRGGCHGGVGAGARDRYRCACPDRSPPARSA